MTARDLGFVTARAIAVLLLANCLRVMLDGFVFYAQGPSQPLRLVWPFIIPPLAFLLFAGLIWRSAASFGEVSPSPNQSSLSSASAGRLAILTIAVYMTFANFSAVVNFVLDQFEPHRGEVDLFAPERGYTIGDLATFAIAVIAILAIRYGLSFERLVAYPRLEPEEE